ncbi:hypothetical protein SISSUDRAFT_1057718 [Sistotremastrum suecicum HHB10207 ss-3]|uniref:PCI domain-containing protein n=1 Tax=Sistotremastrum suecicum HHB10207 ss-3 TaxID=1314776 RepID=A0A166I1X8_9AGAM|nr:hypothetical protein SISSUDRAFT_1057718 [Sistotremastrum suecicum HHB10207 ss-3]
MNVDLISDNNEGKQPETHKKSTVVVVDEDHPFDLENYISSYSGSTAIARLQHIATTCPAIAKPALRIGIQQLLESRDTHQYTHLTTLYNSLATSSEIIPINSKWVQETAQRNAKEKNKLETELKTYSSNMIKESIRMAHRDLGDYYRLVGENATALKHYTKCREYCTTSQHILEMCIIVLELLIEQKNYSHISTYVFKADSALDTQPSSATSTAPGIAPKKSAERDRVQTKLDLATALSSLGTGQYEKAASSFLRLGSLKSLEDWNGKLISGSDIAIYATLCSLATLSRSAIKAQVLENDNFGVYIEQEPYVRELLDAYMASKFHTVLAILQRYSTRHALDIHLAPHISALTVLIRNRALVLYFQPFQSIRLEKMGQAFGLSIPELEGYLVPLIQSGDIKGRIDSKNKATKSQDQRAQLYQKAVQTGNEIQSTNRKLLLRMALIHADLVVKAPKEKKGNNLASEHPSVAALYD